MSGGSTGAGQLGWYLRRLSRMGPSEIVARVGDEARRRTWARRQVAPGVVSPVPADVHATRAFGTALPAGLRESVPADVAASLVEAAERVLAGTWTVLGAVRPDSADPDWFLDPVTGRRAPQHTLCFKVNHRDESVTGNIKQVWEMSRHHHLTVLAAAYWLTEDEKYAQVCADQLRSWWRANPFLSGVHWTSGIEAGVRLLAWVWIRRLLHEWPKVADLFEHDDDALRQIAWHQEFLAAFRSVGSSANNHVIAEAAGSLAAASAFGWFDRSAAWRSEAAALLATELEHNSFPDGLNRELASEYHYFVIELGLLGALEADAAGAPMPDTTWALLRRASDAGAAVLDVRGHAPRQGDGDEGRALVVDDPHREATGVALGSAVAVLGAPDWAPTPPPSVQAALLAGVASLLPRSRTAPASASPAQRPQVFPEAGMTVLRSRPQDGAEIWCRVDAGPLGFLSIAAHGHADALSVEVRHDGVELLIDPGTYCYHGEPQWRSYFRSTLAHNTLMVGEVDQAESGGPFLWTTHPTSSTVSRSLSQAERQSVVVEHDGYQRLTPPVGHRRGVTLDSSGRTLTFEDTVELTGGSQPVALAWHLGPDVDVSLDGRRARLTWTVDGQAREGTLELPDALTWSLHRGEQDPVLGWYSPGFGKKVPTFSLIGRSTPTGFTRLVTVLRVP